MSNLQKYADFSIEDAEQAEEELKKLGTGGEIFRVSKLPVGKTRIRFLPGRLGEKWALLVQQHFINLPGGARPAVFPCPRFHAKRPCPACIKADHMREEGTGNPDDYTPKLAIFSNFIDRKDPESGVRVLQYGKQIYDQLLAIRRNEDGGGNFTDPGPEGFDIVLEKKGSGLNTEYTVLTARPSPLGEQSWLDGMHDLKRYGRVPSEDELVGMLGGGGNRGGGRSGGGGFGGGGGRAQPSAPRGRSAQDDVMDTGDE